MEGITVRDLSFCYPNGEEALSNVDFSVKPGEFVTVCGISGCGKTTLLRLLKPELSPCGERSGEILFGDRPLSALSARERAEKIGFVMQDPENQLVTDKVWHELAYGLENLGIKRDEIRARVSEMASFFGIEKLFLRDVSTLSGGQKQTVNLASVMVMQPSVLLLDEPSGQLDPIAAREFFACVKRVSGELGTTVILAEHRLEEAIPISDRVLVLDKGRIFAFGTPSEIYEKLKDSGHGMFGALPTPMRIFGSVRDTGKECPVDVRDGKRWLAEYTETHEFFPERVPKSPTLPELPDAVELRDVYFRYERKSEDVLHGLNLSVRKGELLAVVGGNGAGKSTLLSVLCGIATPYCGTVRIFGEKRGMAVKGGASVGMLVQDPHAVFLKSTVEQDLADALATLSLSEEEKRQRLSEVLRLCRIENLTDRHPYDLSGGEVQRAAIAKLLLRSPEILLLDEPTKGLDADFKRTFAGILAGLKERGTTVVMVSHDIEFCAEYADRCALLFGGEVTSEGQVREFFAGKNFYTTAASRMARSVIPTAVTVSDVVLALGGNAESLVPESTDGQDGTSGADAGDTSGANAPVGTKEQSKTEKTNKASQTSTPPFKDASGRRGERQAPPSASPETEKKSAAGTVLTVLFLLIIVPLTVLLGMRFFTGRKYYLTSLLVMAESIPVFLFRFEKQKPSAREIVLLSVLCGIAVISRAAFFMLPQFKPALAFVIVAGAFFGAQGGFLVGSMTAFISNFFFGQGPWTPWQMFAFGIVGALAGVLFSRRAEKASRPALCLFGALSALILYGGIMNLSSVLLTQSAPSLASAFPVFLAGLPFDALHALSTAFFLFVSAKPFLEKLGRVRRKYY